MFNSKLSCYWVIISWSLKWCLVAGVILTMGAFPATSFAKTIARPLSQHKIVRIGQIVLLSHGTATHHPDNASPNIVQTQCLATDSTSYSNSPNDLNTFAEVENNCLATTTGNMSMYFVNNCPAINHGNGYTSWNFRLVVNFVLCEYLKAFIQFEKLYLYLAKSDEMNYISFQS